MLFRGAGVRASTTSRLAVASGSVEVEAADRLGRVVSTKRRDNARAKAAAIKVSDGYSFERRSRTKSLSALPSTALPVKASLAALTTAPICLMVVAPVSVMA